MDPEGTTERARVSLASSVILLRRCDFSSTNTGKRSRVTLVKRVANGNPTGKCVLLSSSPLGLCCVCVSNFLLFFWSYLSIYSTYHPVFVCDVFAGKRASVLEGLESTHLPGASER